MPILFLQNIQCSVERGHDKLVIKDKKTKYTIGTVKTLSVYMDISMVGSGDFTLISDSQIQNKIVELIPKEIIFNRGANFSKIKMVGHKSGQKKN